MFKTSVATLFLFTSTSSFAFDCTAIDRYSDKGELRETRSALNFTVDNKNLIKMETELNGQLYFITYSKEDEDGLLQIINSKDDTKGLVGHSSFNKYGSMSLSSVDGDTVHRLECFK